MSKEVYEVDGLRVEATYEADGSWSVKTSGHESGGGGSATSRNDGGK